MSYKTSQRLGLDIGSHSIKLVSIEKTGTHFKLGVAKTIPLYGPGENYDSEGPKKSVVLPKLVEAFRELRIQPKRVKQLASCISGTNLAAKEIKTINLGEEEMASAMLSEARKHIPLDGSETVVDYQILGEDLQEPDKVRVLLAATSRKLYDIHLEVVRDLDLKPGIIDLESLAAINSWMLLNELPEEGVFCFLHVGARHTSLSVLGRRAMFFTREIPVAGNSFNEELIAKYGLNWSDAERTKLTEGMSPNLPMKKDESTSSISMEQRSALELMRDEINRSLRYYVKETGMSDIRQFHITGGGARLKGIGDYLNSKYNVPVIRWNPFEQIEGGDVVPVEEAPQYAAAVGLALRGD
ncbi:MAG: type IV pilus assembly protein PilM [bacterium]|nr:type IV pilus assembly protein PilM [bacterium]